MGAGWYLAAAVGCLLVALVLPAVPAGRWGVLVAVAAVVAAARLVPQWSRRTSR